MSGAKKNKSEETQTVNKTQIIVALIGAIAAILGAYWQFVWKPAHSSPVTSSPQRVEYIGRVLDSSTEEAIHNAKVTFDFQGTPPIVYTDSEGIYRFALNVDGEKISGHVTVDADGYEKYDRNITLFTDNPSIEDIRLIPR